MRDNKSYKGNEEKTKFRKTKRWRDFREHMKEVNNKKDSITMSKLYKTWNLHHLDPEHYELLEDDRFVALNSMTHDFVEWLYKYYRKDPDVLERIRNVMEKMKAFELQPDL